MHIYLCVCSSPKDLQMSNSMLIEHVTANYRFYAHFRALLCSAVFFEQANPRRGAPRLIKKAPPDQGRFNWPWYVSFSASLMKLSIQSTDRKMLWSFCVFNGKMKLVEKGNYHRSTAGNKVDFKNASLFFTTHSILRCTFIVNFLLLLHLVFS